MRSYAIIVNSLVILLLVLLCGAWADITLDGVDDTITTSLEGSADCTNTTCWIDGWLSTTQATFRYAITKGDANSSGWRFGYASDGTLYFEICSATGTGAADRKSSTSINDGVMRHVAVVFTTSTSTSTSNDITLYVNGVVDQQSIVRDGNVYAPNNSNVGFSLHGGVGATLADFRLGTGNPGAQRFVHRAQSKHRGVLDGATVLSYWPLDDCLDGASGNNVTFKDRASGRNDGTGNDGSNNTGLTCVKNTFLTWSGGAQ